MFFNSKSPGIKVIKVSRFYLCRITEWKLWIVHFTCIYSPIQVACLIIACWTCWHFNAFDKHEKFEHLDFWGSKGFNHITPKNTNIEPAGYILPTSSTPSFNMPKYDMFTKAEFTSIQFPPGSRSIEVERGSQKGSSLIFYIRFNLFDIFVFDQEWSWRIFSWIS